MIYDETTSAPVMTQAQELSKDIRFGAIGRKIAHDQGGTAAKLEDLISKGQSRLSSAQGLVETAMTNEGVKVGKDFVLSLLAPSKDVIAILDVVSQIHPAVQVAVGVLKALVLLEMDRQDNDKKIAALYYTMTDMLFVLSYLDPVFKDDDGLKTMLQRRLDEIIQCMRDFGNFCDTYYKHKSLVRMMFSTRYKGKLADIAGSFAEHKAELKHLTQQKTAAAVVVMKANLEDVSAQVSKIHALLEAKSSDEKKVAMMVQDAGGEAALLNNNEAIEKIAKALNKKIDPSIMYTMRTDLDKMLKSNAALFELKMKMATVEIKEAVDRSTEKILLRLDAGPHDSIEDPDIREVWKDMQWRMSCKVRPFVDAVHLHFMQVFAKHERETGNVHPDHWTLHYMSQVILHPAIGNAIDQDSSGFISVFEINRFFHRKPHGWTSAQWLAYWAIGWYKNAIAMQKRCADLLDSVESSLDNVLPVNSQHINAAGYRVKNLWEIRLLVRSFYSQAPGHLGEEFDLHETLEKLRLEKQVSEIKVMKVELQKLKYQLDDREAVAAICRSQQIEVKLLSFIYLMLKRHAKIIDLATKMVLDEQEFWTMNSSLQNITKACHSRLRTLLECWRQQRFDVGQQLRAFASGMYEDFYKEFYEENSKNNEQSTEDSEVEDSSEESSIEDYVIEDGDAMEDDEDENIIADEAIWKLTASQDLQTNVNTAGKQDDDQSHQKIGGERESSDFDDPGRQCEVSRQHGIDGNGHIPLLCGHGDKDDNIENLLVYSLPPQPEVTRQYYSSDANVEKFGREANSEKIQRLTKKQTKEKTVDDRILAAETKLAKIEQILETANLGRIEPLLQEVLSITRPLARAI